MFKLPGIEASQIGLLEQSRGSIFLLQFVDSFIPRGNLLPSPPHPTNRPVLGRNIEYCVLEYRSIEYHSFLAAGWIGVSSSIPSLSAMMVRTFNFQ